jgi:hypothetical protein
MGPPQTSTRACHYRHLTTKIEMRNLIHTSLLYLCSLALDSKANSQGRRCLFVRTKLSQQEML